MRESNSPMSKDLIQRENELDAHNVVLQNKKKKTQEFSVFIGEGFTQLEKDGARMLVFVES